MNLIFIQKAFQASDTKMTNVLKLNESIEKIN